MTWNYRVIEFVDPATDEPWQAIHEVHYDEQGRPTAYSEDPAIVMTHDSNNVKAELCWVLERMKSALLKPVLVERDFQQGIENRAKDKQ